MVGWYLQGRWSIEGTWQALYVWRNNEARSCNHCCSIQAIRITFSECVLVALGIHHAKRMRRIVSSAVAYQAHNILPNCLINFTISGAKIIERKMCVLIFFINWYQIFLFLVALRPNAGHSLFAFLRFLDHTQRRTTVGRTPLDAWSARRSDLTWQHTTLTRDKHLCFHTGFEPAISAGGRPYTVRKMGDISHLKKNSAS